MDAEVTAHTHIGAARTRACLEFRPRRPPSTTTIPRPIALPDGSRPAPNANASTLCQGSTLPRPTITDRVPTLPLPHTHTHTHFSG